MIENKGQDINILSNEFAKRLSTKLELLIKELVTKTVEEVLTETLGENNKKKTGRGGMVAIEPDIKDEAKFPIGKTAKILGITPKTLRIYNLNGFIRCDISPINGRKVFRGKEIKRFWRTKY
jgi:hypothetical protein